MASKVRLLLIGTSILFIASVTVAQTSKQDVLYLRNGSIIKGTIIQFIPDKTVKIQTDDGSICVYPSSEIEKIQGEDRIRIKNISDSTSQKKGNNIVGSLILGTAIPGNDFGNAAVTGFTIGFQLKSKKEIGFLANFSYSYNNSPLDEGWISIIAITGVNVGIRSTETNSVYLAPIIGLYLQKCPAINANGVGFAYGGMVEYEADKRIGFGIRYVGSTPEYKYKDNRFRVSTSMIHVYLAINI